MDDDDDFLYGTEEPAVKRARVEPEGAGDGQEVHSQPTKQQQPDDDSESEYESDESDIDIVIDTGAPKKQAPAAAAAAAAKKEAPAASSAASASSDTPQAEGAPEEQAQPAAKLPGIDIDKVGELDGKPITEHNLEDFEDKPWRMPGADITDYFNYGFDEFTWMAYCEKQNRVRGDFNPQNMMAMMGMSMMGMPGMPQGGGPMPMPGAGMPMPGGEGMPDMFKMMQGMNQPK